MHATVDASVLICASQHAFADVDSSHMCAMLMSMHSDRAVEHLSLLLSRYSKTVLLSMECVRAVEHARVTAVEQVC